jgi:hypothetical protein
VITEDGTFSVFDLAASSPLRNRLVERSFPPSDDPLPRASALFSPDGRTLAVSYGSSVSGS